MSEASPPRRQSEGSPQDRLDSWKEIAAYLQRDVTTVQRWEKREGMPVHRHLHDRQGSVYASRAELDAWASSRSGPADEEVRDEETGPGTAKAGSSRRVLARSLAATGAVLLVFGWFWLRHREAFWRNPIAEARFQSLTESEDVEQAAAVSRDGHFVAFLSDRGGPTDVWVAQVGSGELRNLTQGKVPELVNPSVRTLGFSPDGSFVTFWARRTDGSGAGAIDIWAVPTLGGDPKQYLDGAAELDWSRDGTQLAYHTPGPGDPLFVGDGRRRLDDRPIFTASPGQHSHFPVWGPGSAHIYFALGVLPDRMDIWRIASTGGAPERITSHEGRVSYPVMLDRRTLMYLASDPDGAGPWLYSVDVERRVPHRLSHGLDRFTSLAASGDGRRLVVTLASMKSTLWRVPIVDSPGETSSATRVPGTTGSARCPRLAPHFLLYVSTRGSSEGIWRLENGTSTELWSGQEARIIGAPAVSPNGRQVAFSARQHGQTLLYTVEADGTNARVVADTLDLRGTPAWEPDGRSITTAADDHGVPHLFRVPLDGRPPTPLVREYSLDPAWAPDGRFVVYSGPDIGTAFAVKAVTSTSAVHPLPALTLTRGARHIAVLPSGPALVLLRGDIRRKNLWLVDLATGTERPLTNLAPDFEISDFDVSPDGRELVVERVQERSAVALLDLPRP